jgi:GNAT superfamily N-acetyltransferase
MQYYDDLLPAYDRPGTPIRVRDAIEGDFGVVTERMLDIEPPDYIREPAFCSWCRNPKCHLLVAESGDEGVVGLVLLQLGMLARVQRRLEDDVAYIGALRVSRQHRRRRIGVRLITAAYQLARSLNLGCIKMKVSPVNDQMKLLVAKHLMDWEGLSIFDSRTGEPLDPRVQIKSHKEPPSDCKPSTKTKKKTRIYRSCFKCGESPDSEEAHVWGKCPFAIGCIVVDPTDGSYWADVTQTTLGRTTGRGLAFQSDRELRFWEAGEYTLSAKARKTEKVRPTKTVCPSLHSLPEACGVQRPCGGSLGAGAPAAADRGRLEVMPAAAADPE